MSALSQRLYLKVNWRIFDMNNSTFIAAWRYNKEFTVIGADTSLFDSFDILCRKLSGFVDLDQGEVARIFEVPEGIFMVSEYLHGEIAKDGPSSNPIVHVAIPSYDVVEALRNLIGIEINPFSSIENQIAFQLRSILEKYTVPSEGECEALNY